MNKIKEMAEILVPLHRRAVERTLALLFERLDFSELLRRPSLQRADEY